MLIWLIILHLCFNLTYKWGQAIWVIFIKHTWDLFALLFAQHSMSDISHSLTWHSVIVRQGDGELLLHKTSKVQEEHKVFCIVWHGEELWEQVHLKAILLMILHWWDQISTCLNALPLMCFTTWLPLHDLVDKYRETSVLDQTWLWDDTVHTSLLYFGKHGSIQVLYQMQGLGQICPLSSDASGVEQTEKVWIHWLVVNDLAPLRDECFVDLAVLFSWVENFWIDPVLVTALVLRHDTTPGPPLHGLLLGSLVVQERAGLQLAWFLLRAWPVSWLAARFRFGSRLALSRRSLVLVDDFDRGHVSAVVLVSDELHVVTDEEAHKSLAFVWLLWQRSIHDFLSLWHD